MMPVLTPVWLTDAELDQVARTIGSAFDALGDHLDPEVLHNINAEIGMTKVRSGANTSRAALAKLMSCPNALMLNDTEMTALLQLDLPDAVRRKLTSGF